MRSLFDYGSLLAEAPTAGLLGGPQAPSAGAAVPQAGATPPFAPVAPAPPPAPEPPKPQQSVAGRIHDKIQNLLIGDTPQGYEGLLTPEEIQKVKPSLWQALSEDNPNDTYRKNLDQFVAHKQFAVQVQRQQDLEAGRKAIFNENPPPASGSEADISKWAYSVLPRLMQLGDHEGVKELSPIAEKFAQTRQGFEPKLFQDPKGNLHYLTPQEGRNLPDGWKPIQTSGGNGVPQLFVKPNGERAYLTPTAGMQVPTGWKPENTAKTEMVQDAVQGRADAARLDQGTKAFVSAVKPLSDRAAMLEQALLTLDDAAHSSDPSVKKTLATSALVNFIQAADQKVQVRYQVLNYFKQNVDQSLPGRWEVFKNRIINGTLPPKTMEAMITHLTHLSDLTRKEIDAKRADAIKRRPDLEDALPASDSFFPMTTKAPGDATPAAAAATPAAGAYSPNNPFAKKKP